jgi:hypothetical protein
MSLTISSEGEISRPVLLAISNAIKALEIVTGGLQEHQIAREDDESFTRAKRLLWSVLENNGYTIDIDTNRLRKNGEKQSTTAMHRLH